MATLKCLDMHSFRLIEHTADMGLSARADSREELFSACAFALREMLTGTSEVSAREQRGVRARGLDDGELLVSWLNELLFLFESEGFLLAEVHGLNFEKEALTAEISGEAFDPTRHSLEREVKMVTYHQLQVGPGPRGWEARVYVDL